MIYTGDFKNCRAVMRDSDTGKTIADTKILEYDKRDNIIGVSAGCFESRGIKHVSVLIVVDGSLYEYLGYIRNSVGANLIGIALYEGKEREDRACKRYEIKARGMVENVLVLNKPVKLHKGIDVEVCNISANGVLIKSFQDSFYIGSEFQLLLEMDNNKIMFNCEVVRVEKEEAGFMNYGCKFLTAQRI